MRVLYLAVVLMLASPTTGWAAGWDAGPEANPAQAELVEGVIDAPAPGAVVPVDRPLQVAGWVVDTSAQGWAGIDAVHVYQGKAGEGGRFLAAGMVARSRPDVASALNNAFWAASGFEAVVPVGLLKPGPAQLTVYAHSPDKGWWSRQVDTIMTASLRGPVLQVETPLPASELKTSKDDYTIAGYALDPGATYGSGVDQVEVYIYGERGSPNGQRIGMATMDLRSEVAAARYGTQFGQSGWSLTIRPTRYRAGNTILYIYADSYVTGRETLVKLDLNFVEQ
jgi:hypothetical protein